MKFRRIQGHLRLQDTALKTTTLSKRGHRFICRGFLSKLGVAEQETDEIPTTMVWNRRFSVINDSFAKGKPVKTVDLDFYTDGAFFGRNAGAAVVVTNKEGLIVEEEAIYLGQNSNAYQAEILAIKSAAELIQLRWPEYRVITLYSDCQAALQAVGQNFVKSQLVLDTVAALNQAARNNVIHLRWVKGHCGIIGNERADVLAKEGALDPLREAAQIPKLPPSVIKSLHRDGLERRWNEHWQSRTDCRQTKQWFPSICKNISFKLLRKGRKEFSEAVQLITGHNFLQRHKVIVQEDDDPLCRSCGEDEETSHHVIAECPAFAATRLRVLGTPVLQGTLHWSTQIAEFLREINFSSLQDQGVE